MTAPTHPGSPGMSPGLAARLRGVGVVRSGATLLADVDLDVRTGRAMAVIGPNGAGKTTLLRILSTHLFPSRGHVEVLGGHFGRTDLRRLRQRVALASVAMTRLVPMTHTAEVLVAAGRRGVLRVGAPASGDDLDAARVALGRVGVDHLADRVVATLSQGEWQRVQIARALVAEPELVLLDEPFAGLDLGGRESLVADLDTLLARPDTPTLVMVAHHLEEFPTAVEDAAVLRGGRVLASGPVDQAVTDEVVSRAFGVPVSVERVDGRLSARVRRA